MAKEILIGKITSVHGIKGAVNLMSYSEDPEDITKYKNIFDKNKKPFQFKLISAAKGKNKDMFIVQIAGVKDRNEAELLVNTDLYINRDDLENLADDEFYYVDLIGLDVLDMDNKKIGKVIDVADHGAGGMLEIEFDKFEKKEDRIQTFAFRNKIFPEVNIKKRYIKIQMPEFVEVQVNK